MDRLSAEIAGAAGLLLLLVAFLAWAIVRRNRQRTRQQLAMDMVEEGFWDWSPVTARLYLNRSFIQTFGYPDDTRKFCCGILPDRLHPDDHAGPLQTAHRSLQLGNREFRQKFRMKRCDGQYRTVRTLNRIVRTDRNGRALRVTGCLQDISELEQVSSDCARSVRERDRVLRLKDELLSMLSHEIRTPMNAITGLSRLMLQNEPGEKQHNYAHNIDVSCRKLLETVDNIFDLSRLESGRYRFRNRDFHLYLIWDRLADALQQTDPNHRINALPETDPGVPFKLHGDPDLIARILLYLCLQHPARDESLDLVFGVSVRDRSQSRARLFFTVHDKADAADELSSLTRIGEPGPNAAGIQGTSMDVGNLRMRICEELARLMSGTLYGRASGNGFVAVGFEIETGLSTAAGPANEYRCPAEQRRRLILLGLTNPDTGKRLQQILEIFGWNVNRITPGTDSASIADGISLVVSDGESMQSCALFTKRLPSRAIPLLRITPVDPAPAVAADAFSRVVDIAKPLTPSTLLDSVIAAMQADRGNYGDDSRCRNNGALIDILLVEDNRVNQQVARELLEQSGVRVTLAENGLSAVNKVSSRHFDLILMDIQMPEMDGLTATRLILENHPGIPVIAMTAHAQEHDRQMALAAGMSDFLTKPIDSTTLYGTLRQWLPAETLADMIPPARPVETARGSSRFTRIDFPRGIAQVGNNEKLFTRLLQDFARDHRDDPDLIRAALEIDDFHTVERLLHTLSGIAANIAADGLTKAAKMFEANISLQNPAGIRSSFDSFNAEFSAVIKELEIGFGTRSVPEAPYRNPDHPGNNPESWLQPLKLLLEHGDSYALDLLAETQDPEFLGGHPELMADLRMLTSRFQFDEALEVLETILRIHSNRPPEA